MLEIIDVESLISSSVKKKKVIIDIIWNKKERYKKKMKKKGNTRKSEWLFNSFISTHLVKSNLYDT